MGRTFKVYDSEGKLNHTAEKSANLKDSVVWRPTGNWIAVPQQFPNKSTIALFEKNGLRHRELVLPFDLQEEPVVQLRWSEDSDILAIRTCAKEEQRVYLYTIGNYHWYLKQVLIFEQADPLALLHWDTRCGAEHTLHVLKESGKHLVYRWAFAVDRNNSIVGVIDGKRLLLTAFAFGAGNNSAVANPSGVFSFGGTDKSAPPAFGSGTTSVTSATATPTNNTFGFSTTQKPATPMFGSGSTQQSSTPAVAATKPFTLGGGAPTTPSASPASGGFSFSAVATKNTTAPTAGTNLFGSPASASKPSFNFGGNTATQAAAAGSPAGGFSFATTTKKEDSASTNMFGSPNTGVVKPNFSFSSNNPTPAPTFGGFGAPAAAAPTATSTNQSKPFAFGASTPAAAPQPPLGGNLFANAVSATQNQTKPSGVFSFGAAKSTAGTTAGNAPFSFGGASAGGIASPPSNQGLNTAKPFSFGGAGGTPAPNVFGSPAPAPPASNPTGGFNFGGVSPAQQANAGNMFAPTPESRPIRKATRRLQK